MTTLDHSSVNALIRDIRVWCRTGPTRYGPTRRRFYFAAGGLKSVLWRFFSVSVKGDELWFRVEYDMPTGGRTVEHTLLKGGRLFFVDGPFPDIGYVVGAVGSEPPCAGGSPSADDSQRRRLNKNLRGVFA